MNKKIIYLSCENLEGYVTDDHLTYTEIQKMGYTVETLPWTAKIDWSLVDAVIIRTTWDYTENLQKFLQTLEQISCQTRLINCFSTVKWNAQKTYLKDLEYWGLRIIPTKFDWPNNWDLLFKEWNTNQLMIKPQVGASSQDTHIIHPKSIPMHPLFSAAPLIQPFRPRIFHDGELSFHFFNGHYSHTVRKVPKSGDYRVQEEHGGLISLYSPTQKMLDEVIRMYQTIEDHLEEPSLFSRIDLVYNDQEELEIMEVELVEPSLYFRIHPPAASFFAKMLSQYLSK